MKKVCGSIRSHELGACILLEGHQGPHTSQHGISWEKNRCLSIGPCGEVCGKEHGHQGEHVQTGGIRWEEKYSDSIR